MNQTNKIPFTAILIGLISVVGVLTYLWIKRGSKSDDAQKNDRNIQIQRT
jgi:hypothetical protein